MALSPKPAHAFLAPLHTRLAKAPHLEAAVFWESDGWPEDPAEILEPEEILFYIEGLLDEGFLLEWRLVGLAEVPDQPDHLRLYIWETGAAPPVAEPVTLAVLAQLSHPA